MEKRTDRLSNCLQEFVKHELEVEFVKGVDGSLLEIASVKTLDTIATKGEVGCTLSHLKVIKLAKERGYKNVLILEDDVVFTEGVNYLFSEFVFEIKPDWDMLYFGGVHHGKVEDVSENIIKTSGTYTTHAYAIRDTMYDAAINILSKPNSIADISLSLLHKSYNCYSFTPNLAIQREGYSDVIEKHVDYKI